MPTLTPAPRRAATAALALAPASGGAGPAAAAVAAAGETERVSVGPGGAQGDEGSRRPALSADGRFVAFDSHASTLVPGDARFSGDVFVRDLRTGATRRASVGLGGAQANGNSSDPALSANGRLVAFTSQAANLVPGDTNGWDDVFVHDRRTGKTVLASAGPGGAQGNADSSDPALSADGRLVAFTSYASNLVPGDTNGAPDVFVRDLRTGKTTRVSVGPGGAQGDEGGLRPALSADGRFVAFDSTATNLVNGDTNDQEDVFVRDLRTGATRIASVGAGGRRANGGSVSAALSADGRYVAFRSWAANLVPGDTNGVSDVFVRDLKEGATRIASVGAGGRQAGASSYDAAISADGRLVAFGSEASNLVPGDTNGAPDVFVRDLRTGKTTRVSVGPGGRQAGAGSYDAAISADGRLVAFDSEAADLVPGDTNGVSDVFVRTH